MKKQIDVQAIEDILDRDNTAEVKRNKDGKVIVLEVTKKIAKTNQLTDRS